ncbi:MAG: hypothetical protein WC603_03530 [Candidatus Paceibacterota bacterium]|jgi:hypothetical protein
MDYNDLVLQQNKLQKEGSDVLEKLQLIQFISKYGQPFITGSLATSLMTWRDIDIELVDETKSFQNIFDTVSYLFEIDNIKNIQLNNNIGGRIRAENPDGLYLGFQFKDQELWKIDIWFIHNEKQHSGKDDVEWLNNNINEEKRKSILIIKNQMAVHPEYRKTIFSTDIYNAVIKENVKSYNEFISYLNKKGISS